MPPPYNDRSFWDRRFEREALFEWLGDGQQTIIPPLTDFLAYFPGICEYYPRVLHIGAGTSLLQNHIRDTFKQVYGEDTDCSRIVNTDFSEIAVAKGKNSEEGVGGESSQSSRMRWEKLDLLDWTDTKGLLNKYPDGFNVVADKSTSDAISCGPLVTLQAASGASTAVCPLLLMDRSRFTSSVDSLSVSPMELLSLHLASCVRPGGIWIVLSYSDSRFSFLPSSDSSTCRAPVGLNLSKMWIVESKKAVDAPSGQERPGVYAPAVQYHLYILRRTAFASP